MTALETVKIERAVKRFFLNARNEFRLKNQISLF